MNGEHVRDVLPDYVLGSLSPAERAAVERHLAACPECRREADELAEALATLPDALAAASPLMPPPVVKDRLLTAIAAKGTAATASERELPREPGPAGEVRPNPVAPGRQTPSPARRLSWLGGDGWQRFGRIAAVIALAASLIWGVRLTVALETERSLRSEYAALIGQIVSQQEIVFEVVDSDQSVRRILRARQEGSTAYGKLFTRTDLPHVVAMAARLPAAPPGQTFHLWLTSGGETFLAGELTTDDQGFGLIVFDAPQNGPDYDAAELTLQPRGGDAPGGTAILAWDTDSP